MRMPHYCVTCGLFNSFIFLQTAAKTARVTSIAGAGVGASRPSPSTSPRQRIRRHGALAATPTPRCPCPDPRARALATGRLAGFSRNASTRRPRRRSSSHRIRIQPSRARRLAAAARPRPSWPLLREPSNALAPNHPTTHGPRLPPQHGFCGSWASCDPRRHLPAFARSSSTATKSRWSGPRRAR